VRAQHVAADEVDARALGRVARSDPRRKRCGRLGDRPEQDGRNREPSLSPPPAIHHRTLLRASVWRPVRLDVGARTASIAPPCSETRDGGGPDAASREGGRVDGGAARRSGRSVVLIVRIGTTEHHSAEEVGAPPTSAVSSGRQIRRRSVSNYFKRCSCRACRSAMSTRSGHAVVRRLLRSARRRAKIDLRQGREPAVTIALDLLL